MSDQYKVDLSELEGTITKLNGVIRDLGKANACARDDTYLPPGALGSAFDEAHALTNAHTDMKQHIEEVVQHLHSVMDEFGKKTKTAHGAYSDSEYNAQSGMSGGN
ncbi:hypothetical protein [Actinacidiphila oryziradicis]|uniref:Uncharacterized protein n=1 Tax=Actinacidiphila oryziradicis TaxID=2571141 RepID=A0A4U0S871_9ACTN|nr:hypothetical protein [Actinacidiphila oryziradicis]TKA04588.1 hypothetical protein FCI23_35610 [Actinacidiphila oryziradicis]